MIRSYGKNQKKIIFADLDKTHAELIVRLRHDGLTQGLFFRSLVALYLSNDERILSVIEDLRHTVGKFGKVKNRKNADLHSQRLQNEKLNGLTEAEKEEIFDMLEEIGDL